MDNNVGTITLGTKVDTKGVDKGLVDIERKVTGKGFMNKFSRMFSGIFSGISKGTNNITSSISKGMTSIIKDLGSITSSVSGIGTLIGAISLVGIVGMVILASAKSEEARQQLEQIATIVANLINELAQILLPVAEEIVNLIYKAVVTLGVMLEDWFGIDLFTKSVSDNLKSGVKSAKALRKQLLGFDEMNILNKDTGSTSAIGGIGGTKGGTTGGTTKTPRQIADEFKKEVNYVVDEINNDVATQTGLGIREWILENIPGAKFIDDKIIDPIRRLLYRTGLFEPAVEKKKVQKVTNTTLNEIKKMTQKTDKVSQTFVEQMRNNLSSFSMNVKDGIVTLTTETGDMFEMTESQYKELMDILGIDTKKALKNIQDGTSGVVSAFNILDNESLKTFNNIDKNSANSSNNTKTNWFNSATSIIDKFTNNTDSGLLGAVTGVFTKIRNESSNKGEDTKTNWFKTANDIITKYTGKGQDGVVGAVTGAFDSVPQSVENSTKKIFPTITDLIKNYKPPTKTITMTAQLDTSKMMTTLRKLAQSWPTAFQPIVSALQKYGFAKGGIVDIPRLASGGIINRPGKGVPLAVGGEVSREGVIPMDNQSQMALLGREIAKNVVINLTSVTEIDGRQLARVTAQVMNDMNFASNGGVI